MAKLRKMLGKADSPYIITLMQLMETQSKQTLSAWALSYAREEMLPIYQKAFPDTAEIVGALDTAEQFLAKEKKLAEVKAKTKEVNVAARQAEGCPAACAAVRAIAAALSSISTPTSALGMVFYAAAAVAYDREGLEASEERYEELAAQEGQRLIERFKAVMVEDEQNPAKLDWNC